MKRAKSGWLVSVTAGEIRQKCQGRTDESGVTLLNSVKGYPDNFVVTCRKSILENKTDEQLIKEAGQAAKSPPKETEPQTDGAKLNT